MGKKLQVLSPLSGPLVAWNIQSLDCVQDGGAPGEAEASSPRLCHTTRPSLCPSLAPSIAEGPSPCYTLRPCQSALSVFLRKSDLFSTLPLCSLCPQQWKAGSSSPSRSTKGVTWAGCSVITGGKNHVGAREHAPGGQEASARVLWSCFSWSLDLACQFSLGDSVC